MYAVIVNNAHRYANTAFVKCPLAAAKRSVAPEEIPPPGPGQPIAAIVTGEKDDSVVVDFQLPEELAAAKGRAGFIREIRGSFSFCLFTLYFLNPLLAPVKNDTTVPG